MKYLILVGDGMGDLPMPELNHLTPLESAKTPTLDALCQQGELFLTRTVPKGYPPGSDVANLSLLGYRPDQYYTGRAPLEASAMGINLQEDETAFRCNLVTLDQTRAETKMVDYSAGHISTQEAEELINAVQDACGTEQFKLYPGINYRHILVVKGAYPDMDPVPPHDYIGKDVSNAWQRYMDEPTWKTLVTTAIAVLAEHPVNKKRMAEGKNPANGIWLWGEGKLPSMPTLQQQYDITGGLISAVDLLKGLGVNAGLDVINIPGATGYIDTNYKGKADAALQCLEEKDFVFVHVEAPDEAGHQGSLADKLQAIEDFDSKIAAPIVEGLQKRGETFRVIATMDHYTPLSLRTHTDTPVPVLLYDSRTTDKGCGLTFSEKNGNSQGDLPGGLLPDGQTMMKKLLERL